jgi:hypothetical protein
MTLYPPNRYVENHTFISDDLPPLRMELDPAFDYAAVSSFDLKGIARVERHHFVESDGRQVRRLLMLQFEGFLPDNTKTYTYAITNPVRLGGLTYRQDIFGFSVAAEIAEEPEAELAHTARLLTQQGYTAEDELMMVRYATILGDDRRNEFLIFYVESISAAGRTRAELFVDNALRPEFAAVGEALAARALASFRFE